MGYEKTSQAVLPEGTLKVNSFTCLAPWLKFNLNCWLGWFWYGLGFAYRQRSLWNSAKWLYLMFSLCSKWLWTGSGWQKQLNFNFRFEKEKIAETRSRSFETGLWPEIWKKWVVFSKCKSWQYCKIMAWDGIHPNHLRLTLGAAQNHFNRPKQW